LIISCVHESTETIFMTKSLSWTNFYNTYFLPTRTFHCL